MRPVRYIQSKDGLSLAWTRTGSGVPLVRAAAWLTHLEHDHESPIWANWVGFFEEHFDYLRYDERGCGMSERTRTGDLTVDSWYDDLGRVVDSSKISKPFVLFALSQGTAAALRYAVEHPENVSHLIICGGYARGAYHRDNAEAASLYDAIVDVFRLGWDSPNNAFRDVFTKRFVPDGDPEKIRWFSDLCRHATTPEVGSILLRARADVEVSDLLPQVRCPTLVLHAQGDQVAPLEEGQLIARLVPDAQMVVLPSDNHILQADEPAWDVFKDQVLEFVGAKGVRSDVSLTPREQEILDGICAAKSNKEIARDLGVTDKTIRNQVTSIFAKLGVSNRQEAILKLGGASGRF